MTPGHRGGFWLISIIPITDHQIISQTKSPESQQTSRFAIKWGIFIYPNNLFGHFSRNSRNLFASFSPRPCDELRVPGLKIFLVRDWRHSMDWKSENHCAQKSRIASLILTSIVLLGEWWSRWQQQQQPRYCLELLLKLPTFKKMKAIKLQSPLGSPNLATQQLDIH